MFTFSLQKDDFSDSYESPSGQRSQEEENLVIFCKQMLKTRVFKGSYQERRYVESLQGYRDLIVLDSCEHELKNDLKYIHHRISNFYRNPELWLGVTLPDMVGAPAGTCIWTDVEGNPFGKYWFQIRTIRFRTNEVYIKVKPLRSVSGDALSTGNVGSQAENDHNISMEGLTKENIVNLLLSWKRAISTGLMNFLWNDINRENIVAAIRFTFLLFLSILAGSFELIKHLGVFSIRFFAEARLLLHTATPIILKIIELLGKVIGGFYILIAMIWRDLTGSRAREVPRGLAPPRNQYQAISNRPFYINKRAF